MKQEDYLLEDLIFGDDEDGSDEDYSESSSDDLEEGVEVKGAGSQFVDSVKGMLVGFLCFIISWPVLWCGATRTELGKEFAKAVPIEKASKDGQLVFLTGTPKADEIGDGASLPKGKYLAINKQIEYYAVVSKEKSKTQKKGTKQVTTKWTEYTLEWTSSPKPIQMKYKKDRDTWRRFAQSNNLPSSVKNPVVPEGEKTSDMITTPNCTVNDYTVPVKDVRFKGGSKELDKVYLKGKKDSPKVGDKRISYSVYPSDIQYTFSGEKQGKALGTHTVNNEPIIVAADGGPDKLIANLKSEDRMMWWIYLIIGFVLMAAGLNMLVGPLTTLLDFIPYVGEFGAGLIRFILTIVAAVLSLIFYLLVYYWWIVLIIVAGVVGFLIYKKKSAAPASA